MEETPAERPKIPIINRIMALKEAPLGAIKAEYSALFGQDSPCSNNKVFLWRKIAYRLQEIEYGGLTNETQARIQAFIDKYDPVNKKALRPETPVEKEPSKRRDSRLPIPGAIIRKEYKDQTIEVKVLEKGFEWQGQTYRTLSAVAKAVTGDHWNGFLFFKP